MTFNGVAAASTVAGVVFLWSAVYNQRITTVLQDLVRGKEPKHGPDAAISGTGGASGYGGTLPTPTDSALANAALAGVGTLYVWGGSDEEVGWDCSGMVNREANGVGLPIPGYPVGSTLPPTAHGAPTTVWRIWPGAVTVTDPEPGDLCCWVTHMGVYVGNGEMVSALNPAMGTQKTTVQGGSPGPEPFAYRRIKS